MPHFNINYFFNLIFWCILSLSLIHLTVVKKFCRNTLFVILKRKQFITITNNQNQNIFNRIINIESMISSITKYNKKKIAEIEQYYLLKKNLFLNNKIKQVAKQISIHRKIEDKKLIYLEQKTNFIFIEEKKTIIEILKNFLLRI